MIHVLFPLLQLMWPLRHHRGWRSGHSFLKKAIWEQSIFLLHALSMHIVTRSAESGWNKDKITRTLETTFWQNCPSLLLYVDKDTHKQWRASNFISQYRLQRLSLRSDFQFRGPLVRGPILANNKPLTKLRPLYKSVTFTPIFYIASATEVNDLKRKHCLLQSINKLVQ